MPTYQYACTDPACANRFELVQTFTDPNVSQCPICAGAVRKVFSPVGVVFKGSGFYRNDSRTAGGKHSTSDSESSAKSEPSKSAAANSGDSTSSPAKPAEKKSSSTSGDGSSSPGSSSNGKSTSSSSGTSSAAASA